MCYKTWGSCLLDLCPEHLCYNNPDLYSEKHCLCFALGVVACEQNLQELAFLAHLSN